MKRNDNLIKMFKFSPGNVVMKFDRTHTFCHIIALRFRCNLAVNAPASGADNGFHKTRTGYPHQAGWRDIETQTSLSRNPSRFNKFNRWAERFLYKASPTHVMKKQHQLHALRIT